MVIVAQHLFFQVVKAQKKVKIRIEFLILSKMKLTLCL